MEMRSFAGVLAIACLGATTAKATEYQVTILPQLLTDFYGAGESADEFTSNFWNITDTGALAPLDVQFRGDYIQHVRRLWNTVKSPNAQAEIFGAERCRTHTARGQPHARRGRLDYVGRLEPG